MKSTIARFILLFALTLATSCASPLTPSATTTAPEAPTEALPEVSFTQLTPGVWMHTSWKAMPKWGNVLSNGLVVEDGDHAILVDTAWDDTQTERIVQWAAGTLHKPITRAVFTHAHEDKMGGVAALRARGIATYAAPDSNALATERGLTPAEHDLSFDASHDSLQLAPLVIFDPGAGHTTDNIVVALPERDVLFGGCLIRPGGSTSLGNTADADLAHWEAAGQHVAVRFPDASIVVPSHGSPADRALLDQTASLAHTGGSSSTQ